MKVTAHYMAAYLLALFYCSKKGQNKQGDVVKFAMERYISGFSKDSLNLVNDGKMTAAEKQLRFACSNADKEGYTVSLGGGCHALTQEGMAQLSFASQGIGDYAGLQNSEILYVYNWVNDYNSAMKNNKKSGKRVNSSSKSKTVTTSDVYMAIYLLALRMKGGFFCNSVQLQDAISFAMTNFVSSFMSRDAHTLVNNGKMTSAEKNLAFAASNADKEGYTESTARGYHALTMAGSNFLNAVKNNQNAYNTSNNVVLNQSFFDMLNSDISTTYDLDW